MNNKNCFKQKGEILTVVAVTACMAIGVLAAMKLNWDLVTGPLSGEVQKPSGEQQIFINEDEIKLPTFKSKKEIVEKVAQKRDNNNYFWTTNDAMDFVIMESESATVTGGALKGETAVATPDSAGRLEDNSANKDYSETNTQVKGVDEADIVKTNGKYIYYLSKGKLHIFETKTTKTKLIKTIELENINYYATQELYIDENYIVVIVVEDIIKNEVEQTEEKFRMKTNSIMIDVAYPSYHTTGTTMYVYDIHTYDLVKKITTEGSYISSRKINNNIYVVTNKYLYPYSVNEEMFYQFIEMFVICHWQ